MLLKVMLLYSQRENAGLGKWLGVRLCLPMISDGPNNQFLFLNNNQSIIQNFKHVLGLNYSVYCSQ